MRTTAEKLARMDQIKGEDVFGFARSVILGTMDFTSAKPFIDEKATEEEWNASGLHLTDEAIRKAALDYLEFAWGKAQDHRGLSAGRSVDKLTEYAWLLGDDDLVAAIGAAGYAQYGAPKLAVIAAKWNTPIPTDAAITRMIAGDPCRDDCEDGCGQ